jgi:light-regulated signal transduction histidine kinase (bacteriophytochrome)
MSVANNHTTTSSNTVTGNAISHQLHQTAQPLTVLQGLLEVALLSSRTAEEYRGVIQRAMEQSLRISGCFDLVRKLFHLQQSPPDVSSFSVSDLASAVVKSVSDSYAIAGVGCDLLLLPRNYDGCADVVHTSQNMVSAALALILSNLPRWAGSGGAVKVAIDAESQDVLVCIVAQQNAQADSANTPDASLMTAPLHLARTMIASAGGKLTEGAPQFSVLISLPKTQYSPELYETQRIECVHV